MEVSTPTTVSGTPLTSTVWPTGSTPRKSSDAVVAPRTATAVWSATSWVSMKRPWARERPLTVSQVGVDPCTEVVQVLEPAVRVSDDEVMGATALTSGATDRVGERGDVGHGEGRRRAECLADAGARGRAARA